MQPFSRETVVDRRQPALRWSAIFAGVAVALGAWLVLQLLGTAIGLLLLDSTDLDYVYDVGMGTSAWSLLAPIVALFLGGLLAGRVAGYFDRRIAGVHGLLVWAIGSVIGVLAIAYSVSLLASDIDRASPTDHAAARAEIEQSLGPINTRLHEAGKPGVSVEDFVAAARSSATAAGSYNRTVFVNQIDKRTDLDATLSEQVVADLGDRAPIVISAAHELGDENARVIDAAHSAGNIVLAATFALLLSLAAAIGGAMLAARQLSMSRREIVPHTTAPYPVATVGHDTSEMSTLADDDDRD
ncbi:MAG TPA: hypothetical protein VIU61_28025 [Kofleriaceae bacterium]